MNVNPIYASVGSFFRNQPMFRIPKYQRGYAWDKDEIDDFMGDLEKIYRARKKGQPQEHFMGGMVSVRHQITGSANSWFEVVDGQQRLATFVLLITAIIHRYNEITKTAQKQNDTNNLRITEKRIQALTERFFEFEQEINRETTTETVLKLSSTDQQFFSDLIHGHSPAPQRDSHKRILAAFDKISKRIALLTKDPDTNVFLDNLQTLERNIDEDFFILHMVTGEKREAYTLFQVLNDRGKSLTEGDLLRAKTLEMLEGHNTQQNSVEKSWDDILADPTRDTEEYLRWIYASHQGKRPGTTTLFDDFLKVFYPQSSGTTFSVQDADNILLKTQDLYKEISLCRKLTNGEWIFPVAPPVSVWDRSRLSLLINELDNTNSIPLLLAAAKLDHKKFAEIVNVMERFMFRYTIIGKQHHGPILDIVQNEAISIRSNPSGYSLQNLKTNLQNLINSKANDDLFANALSLLRYQENGGSNRPLRYFLITLEDYSRWYHEGAVGEPVCRDTSRVFSTTESTIEHIYPRRASGTVYDVGMEDLKNTIGNLTILGPGDNRTADDDPFPVKRAIFQQSASALTREVGQLTQWDRTAILTRAQTLKEMAVKIFKII